MEKGRKKEGKRRKRGTGNKINFYSNAKKFENRAKISLQYRGLGRGSGLSIYPYNYILGHGLYKYRKEAKITCVVIHSYLDWLCLEIA